MPEKYNINPALNRAVRLKLDAIDGISSASLSGEIEINMAHGMIREETEGIRKLLTELGTTRNGDGLRGTLDRQRVNMVLERGGGDGA